MTNSRENDIEQLNSFLRGELSAVETYAKTLEKLDDDSPVRNSLQSCQQSHSERASKLRSQITSLGGQPSEDSGVWGSFAKAVQASASVFGDEAAVSALKQGEEHGKRDYQGELDELTAPTRTFVQAELLPEQERTLASIEAIKARV